MSLLDLDPKDNKLDMDMINSIFQKWLTSSHGNMFRACGFHDGTFKVESLPRNFLEWNLYRCTHLSNRGDYCCVIAQDDYMSDKYELYEYFITFRIFGQPTKFKVKHLLEWYDQHNI